jgi:hypothetical protein
MGPSKIPDIYLVEREAIRLRRLRWKEIKSSSEGLIREAPGAAAKAPQVPKPAQAYRAAPESLEIYARPPEIESPDLLPPGRRLRNRLRTFFQWGSKEKS